MCPAKVYEHPKALPLQRLEKAVREVLMVDSIPSEGTHRAMGKDREEENLSATCLGAFSPFLGALPPFRGTTLTFMGTHYLGRVKK